MTTTPIDHAHTITRLEPTPELAYRRAHGDHWHTVACSCGWTRKYVSRYRAHVMHAQHAAREAT